MPVVKIKQINEDTKILIWYIREDSQFFESHLRELYGQPYPWLAMADKRKREFLATRYLIQLGLPPGQSVAHLTKNENGSPRLSETPYCFGISHTSEYVSCVISTHQAGCDIERFQERILRLSDRFMTPSDQIWANDDHRLAKTHLIWGIKESAFKTWGRKRIDWKRHIRIDPIEWDPDKGHFTGTIGNDSGLLHFYGEYEYFPQFLFVWSIETKSQ